MKKSVLTVTLNPCLDTIFRINPFEPPKAGQESIVMCAGGKGINVSRALKALKVPTKAMALTGGKVGKLIQQKLHEERVPADLTTIDMDSRINLTVYGASKDSTRIMQNGPKVSEADAEKFRKRYRELLKQSSLVAFCGRNANGLPRDTYAQLINEARDAGVLTALDTSGDALDAGLKAKPHILKLNREEAEALLGRKLNSLAKLPQAAHQLSENIKIVLISLAEEGAIGASAGQVWHIRAPELSAVNNVGCGDAFLAGFIYSYLKDSSFDECLKTAVAAGSAATQSGVPGLINRDIFLKMLKWVHSCPTQSHDI